ncbi:hypothetical protein K501DRAFT_335469 [Backusella circina FSU 941]|nr:hypothetical protein K501DRAFT_335469 [Backusella circina FSU 941]
MSSENAIEDEKDYRLKLSSIKLLKSEKAKKAIIETLFGTWINPSNWIINYSNWSYKPIDHALYVATFDAPPVHIVVQKQVNLVFLTEVTIHAADVLESVHILPTVIVLCLEGIDNKTRRLFQKIKLGCYKAKSGFWTNGFLLFTPELVPHGNSSLEKLVTQQFFKFKQLTNL